MSDPIRFKITSGPAGRNTHIEMNGRRITNCRAVNVDASCDRATTVTLEFINVIAELEVEVAGSEGVVARRDAMGQTAYIYEQAALI